MNGTDYANTPPHSVEMEQAVLGGLLLENRRWPEVRGIVTAGDFYRADHRLIFGTIADLLAEGKPADAVTVFEALGDGAGKAGGLQYINAIAGSTPSAANVHAYAGKVFEFAERRRCLKALEEARAAFETGEQAKARTILQGLTRATENRSLAPVLLDLRVLANTEPEAPKFIIADWMPEGQATLFAGHGGAGKSTIALTAAVCMALGLPLYGHACARRRVLFLSYEDNAKVLHWRLLRICQMLGVNIDDLTGWLFILDASAEGEPLFTETRDGLAQTSALDWLRDNIKATRAAVLIVDGSADAFDGNENNRAQVRRFVRALRRLVPIDGGVMLLHHFDAATAHNTSTKAYSGSTAWHNSCRARWAARPTETGPDADTSRVTIDMHKSNYGGRQEGLELRFNEAAGCYVSDAVLPLTPGEIKDKETAERDAVLRIVQKADAAGDPIPVSKRGDRTGHEVATARGLPRSLTGKRGKKAFYEHLEALRAAKAIRVETVTKPSRHVLEVYRPAAPATEHAPATEQFAPATEQFAPATEH